MFYNNINHIGYMINDIYNDIKKKLQWMLSNEIWTFMIL